MNTNRKKGRSDADQAGQRSRPIQQTVVQADGDSTPDDPPDSSSAKVGASETDMCQLDETLLNPQKDGKFAETHILNPSQFQSSVDPSPNDVATIIEQSASSVMAASQCPIGSMIGDYQITSELGRGGMGVVYRAHHRGLNREAAIKMILHGKHSGDEAVERFLAEAKAVAQLHHPNIVQIFDIGTHEGLPYFSLEFVKGTDLHRKCSRSPQPLDYAASIVETLAKAIQYAHDQSILHRDLKPANILIAMDGTPRITDFGLAKQLEDTDSQSTRTGTIMGSPSYMSPEQARGETQRIGPASDQYSLGAILYELLTGRPPFLATKPLDTVMQVVKNDPVAPSALQPSIDRDLETICLKTLRKEIGQRYESCHELAEDLRRYQEGIPIHARPVGQIERSVRWCRRNPMVASLSAAAVVGILSALIVSTVAWYKVSLQNEEIQRQQGIANSERSKAVRNAALAVKKEALAEERSGLVLTTMQKVMTDVGNDLAMDPATDDTRDKLLNILESMIQQMDAGLKENPDTSAIPTIMSLKAQLAQSWLKAGDAERAEAAFATLYDTAVRRMEFKKNSDASRYNVALLAMKWADARRVLGHSQSQQLELIDKAISRFEDIQQHPQSEARKPLDPSDVRILLNYSEALMMKGVAASSAGQPEDGFTSYAAAHDVRKQVLEQLVADTESKERVFLPFVRTGLNKSILGLAKTELLLGQTKQAITHYEEALASARSRRDDPEDRLQDHDFAAILQQVGEAYLSNDRLSEANVLVQESVRLIRATSEAAANNVVYRERLGDGLYLLSTIEHVAAEPANRGEKTLAESLEIRNAIQEQSPSPGRLIDLIQAQAASGLATEALASLDEFRPVTSRDYVKIAQVYSLLIRSSSADQQQAELNEAWLLAATEALQQAIDAGYRDFYHLTHSTDLDAIRRHADWSSIYHRLQQLAAPSASLPDTALPL